MIQYACTCSYGIPGVESLPPHDHNQEYAVANMLELNPGDPRVDQIVAEHFPLRDGVHVWVDWSKVARAL